MPWADQWNAVSKGAKTWPAAVTMMVNISATLTRRCYVAQSCVFTTKEKALVRLKSINSCEWWMRSHSGRQWQRIWIVLPRYFSQDYQSCFSPAPNAIKVAFGAYQWPTLADEPHMPFGGVGDSLRPLWWQSRNRRVQRIYAGMHIEGSEPTYAVLITNTSKQTPNKTGANPTKQHTNKKKQTHTQHKTNRQTQHT